MRSTDQIRLALLDTVTAADPGAREAADRHLARVRELIAHEYEHDDPAVPYREVIVLAPALRAATRAVADWSRPRGRTLLTRPAIARD